MAADFSRTKIPSKVKEPSPEESGDSADEESRAFASERNLEKEAEESEHDRQEVFRKHLSRAALILFWLFFSIAVFMVMFWAWHLLTPWRFLTDEQLDDIQQLSSGGLVAVVAGYLRRYIK